MPPAGPVAENDLLVVLLDDEEVALDAPLEVDQRLRDLVRRELQRPERRAIVGIEVLAGRRADLANSITLTPPDIPAPVDEAGAV